MKLPPYSKTNVAAALGIWGAIAILLAAVAGLSIPVSDGVPRYALESDLIFRLERSLVIAAILILPTLILGPLLSGSLPRKLSADGIDWEEDRANVVLSLDEFNQRLAELERALSEMAELNED
jgi:hypothetical protein